MTDDTEGDALRDMLIAHEKKVVEMMLALPVPAAVQMMSAGVLTSRDSLLAALSQADALPATERRHGERLTHPFITHHAGVEHIIMMQGDEPWLCWKHPDGQWVTECRIVYPAPATDEATDV